MRVALDYGVSGLTVDVPDHAVVVEPEEPPALPDDAAAVREALARPVSGPALDALVADRVPAGGRVVLVFPDLTRPMPNTTVLPPVLAALAEAGVGPGQVSLLCATGTHRRATEAEMTALVGADTFARYEVLDHVADGGDHVRVGTVDGAPVLLDRRYVEADLRVVTGFVEPHFFAGWSGGPKGTCPGLASTETILEAHSPARIADPGATWMVTDGNPVHEFVSAAAALCPADLCVDVTIDRSRRLTGVFAGPVPDGHARACAFAASSITRPVDGRFEVVLTTNSGHPLDRNLYQAVKGMAAAERVVGEGGAIVMAAACGDGIPEGSAFARQLRSAESRAALRAPGPEVDGWQVQVLGRVLERAEVHLYSEGLDDATVRSCHLVPVSDVGGAVGRALAERGPDARLCVLPRGPLTVAVPDAPSAHASRPGMTRA